MQLMILENRRLRTTLRPGPGMISIGSSPECGIHLPDPRISAHQASITQDEDGVWWLEVVDTSAPTSLNRTVQKARAKLRHADEISIGDFAIRLFLESDKTRDELRRERVLQLTKRHGKTLPLGSIIHKFEDSVTVPKDFLEQLSLLAVRVEGMDTVTDILTPLLRAMLRSFDARCAWVGIRREPIGDFNWSLGLAHDGQPCDRPPFSEKMHPRCLEHTQYLCCPEAPIDGARSAMAVPLVCQPGILGMLYVENAADSVPYSETMLSAFSAMASCVALPVENVLRHSVSKQRAILATEQTVARVTQDALTPKALPQWDDLQIACYRHMGSRRCCDLYDIVQLRDKTASIIVAKLAVDDAALARRFSEIRTMFRAAALYSEAPHLFARAMNWLVHTPETPCAIELATAWINPVSGKVQYCIAGDGVHLGVIHADGTAEFMESNGMPPVGRTRAPAFEGRTCDLASGDTLALATGGVACAKDREGEAFGIAGLEEILCDGLGAAPGHVLGELASELTDFVAGGACPEDISIVLARRE